MYNLLFPDNVWPATVAVLDPAICSGFYYSSKMTVVVVVVAVRVVVVVIVVVVVLFRD